MNIKKISFACASLLCAAALTGSLAACGNGSDEDKVTYTVTFDTDGGSAVASQTVEEGSYATRPEEDPTKEGFVFGNWYADEDLEDPFEFETTVISEDTTVYASWVDESSALTATFYWNYDGAPDNGVYKTVSFEKGGRVGAVADPSRAGYAFGGWYTEDGEEFKPALRYDSSVEFYAKWSNSFTFEAEYTQLTGLFDDPSYLVTGENCDKAGNNYSGNTSGLNLIQGNAAASNGKYVTGLFYNGGYLEFEITSDKAVTDAQLKLVLGCEYADITLTAATYQVEVNGSLVPYTATIKLGDGTEWTPSPGLRGSWQEINIGNITLNEGVNSIILRVNNSETPCGDAGTIDAASPMVDCIKIITDAQLTMTEYNKQ